MAKHTKLASTMTSYSSQVALSDYFVTRKLGNPLTVLNVDFFSFVD